MCSFSLFSLIWLNVVPTLGSSPRLCNSRNCLLMACFHVIFANFLRFQWSTCARIRSHNFSLMMRTLLFVSDSLCEWAFWLLPFIFLRFKWPIAMQSLLSDGAKQHLPQCECAHSDKILIFYCVIVFSKPRHKQNIAKKQKIFLTDGRDKNQKHNKFQQNVIV